ncbi:MAG TPA: glycosyltransferase [Terriglobia bacterium]|nr:glycosyltransferase [Terriglobia bacterium]
MPRPFHISVVINTYNRAASLETTLKSLRRLNYPRFEVIVVNGPSTDNTLEVLKNWTSSIRVDTCSDRNLSISRNIGIEMARGDLVAFIDDDAVADENWLDDAVAGFDADEVGGVGGSIFNYTGYSLQYQYTVCDRLGNAHFDRKDPALEFSYPGCLRYPNLQGGNSVIRRKALIEISGFDEEFDYYLDETDVCLRLVDAGYLLKQLPNAFVYHRNLPSHLRNASRVVTNWSSIIKNKAYFALKNTPPDMPFTALMKDWGEYIAGVESTLKEQLSLGNIEPEVLDRFYTDADASLRTGILRGIQQPRRLLGSDAAKAARGPVALDVLDWKHPGTFKPCPVVLEASEKLTVCLLSQGYLPEVKGGIPRLTYDLACGLAERGHIVHVLTKSACDHSTVDFENDVWVHRLIPNPEAPPVPKGVKIPQRIWQYSTTLLHELRWIHSVHPIDIVESPVWDAEGIAAILDGSFRVITNLETPLKVWIETNPHLIDGTPRQRQFFEEQIAAETLLAQRSSGLRALSDGVLETMQKLYEIDFRPGQASVLPLGMEDRSIGAPAAKKSDFTDVLFTGRFELRKGIDVLLRVIPPLCTKHPRARFILAGDDPVMADGTCFAALFRQVHAAAPFLNRVIFAGAVTDKELESLLAQCDIFVAPSRYESFGLVFLEAMMFGKPVVGCRAGGMGEVIEEGFTGLLSEPGDAETLRAALDTLISDPQKRQAFGKAGRARFLAHFTRDKLIDRTLDFYQQVIRSSKPVSASMKSAALPENILR